MTSDWNSLLPGIERLVPLMPDARCTARVRAKCHVRLTRRRGRGVWMRRFSVAADERAAMLRFGRRVVAPVVLGISCLYLVSIVDFVLRLDLL